MKVDRKIAMVVNHVKMEDEDMADVAFWLSKSPGERLTEVVRLRQNYFSWADRSFPEKIEKVVHQRHV
ncbi:hypothetical protein [Mucilaginibacter sp.]|uniref:hypothetical protein n=1 Tax=Mucilaginibacter sp. TaxID=1882438 RepID=UPI00262998FC|nr:hypothetical protein [Mucilaginibacter sp.]MDB5032077.1 hypothetical protein [Mucilaginibacter sp.]